MKLPPLIFGTSCLGNLYQALPFATKLAIVREICARCDGPIVLDTAGKYGAGLALESIGQALRQLGVPPGRVVISNKLGWLRVPLTTAAPTFEPGAWVGLEHDAEQRLSYDGILACHEQGRALLGEPYAPRLASVHDPDEWLLGAADATDRKRRLADLHGAYRALFELKAAGEVEAVGVGAKDWTVIRELAEAIELDWVMLACSLTIYRQPPELVALVAELAARGVKVINSAVFNAGFLIGGDYFDYRRPTPDAEPALFAWREAFLRLCAAYAVVPAAACVQFALSVPGVVSVALNTGKPERIVENIALTTTRIPTAFWEAMREAELIRTTVSAAHGSA